MRQLIASQDADLGLKLKKEPLHLGCQVSHAVGNAFAVIGQIFQILQRLFLYFVHP